MFTSTSQFYIAGCFFVFDTIGIFKCKPNAPSQPIPNIFAMLRVIEGGFFMYRYAVIYNPHSGHNNGESVGQKIEQALIKNQHKVELMPTEGPKDATRLAKKAARAGFDVVVAVGGDGTINEVVSGLATLDQPPYLGIVPAGTVNNLTRMLQIPLDIDQAIENLQQVHLRPLDVGQVNDDYLISTMTLGILADAALNVTQSEKQKWGPLAFLSKGIHALAEHQHYPLTIETPDRHWQKDTQFLLVTLTNSVGGFTNFNPEAQPDDGYFHVFVAPKMSLARSVMFLPYFLTGNFKKIPGMTYFKANEISITVDNQQSAQTRIDGDPSAKSPLKMRLLEHKLQVITPNPDL